MEALCGITPHRRLKASWRLGRSERYFGEAKGAYIFRGELAEKARYDARSASLCNHGVFWSLGVSMGLCSDA